MRFHLKRGWAGLANPTRRRGGASCVSQFIPASSTGCGWSADILVRPCALVNTKADTKIHKRPHRRTRMSALPKNVSCAREPLQRFKRAAPGRDLAWQERLPQIGRAHV